MRRPVNCLVKGVKRRESWCSGPIAWLSELRSHTLSWVSRGSPTTNMHTHFYMDSHTSAFTHSTHSIQQHTLTYNWWCTHSNKTQPKHTPQTHNPSTHSQHTLPSTHSRHTPMWRVKQKIKAKTDRGKVLIGVWSCLNYENIIMKHLKILLVQKKLIHYWKFW